MSTICTHPGRPEFLFPEIVEEGEACPRCGMRPAHVVVLSTKQTWHEGSVADLTRLEGESFRIVEGAGSSATTVANPGGEASSSSVAILPLPADRITYTGGTCSHPRLEQRWDGNMRYVFCPDCHFRDLAWPQYARRFFSSQGRDLSALPRPCQACDLVRSLPLNGSMICGCESPKEYQLRSVPMIDTGTTTAQGWHFASPYQYPTTQGEVVNG